MMPVLSARVCYWISMNNFFNHDYSRCFFAFMFFLTTSSISPLTFAQEFSAPPSNQVELNGDQIEYKAGSNTMLATGNVSVVRGDTVLFADQMEFNRATQEAHAFGHVILETPQGEIWAEEMDYNF